MKAHASPCRFWFIVVAVLLAPFWSGPAPALAAPPSESGTTLEIDLKAPATPISPILHGLMTEEINHSYDGGLYAELIRNRAFLDDAYNEPVHWSVVKQPDASGSIHIVTSHPLTDKLPNSLEVDVKEATAEQRFRNVNPGGMQWKTDLIGYNGLGSYGPPSYYAQAMFASRLGNVTPRSVLQAEEKVLLPYCVSRQTETGKLFLKVVNPGAEAQDVTIQLLGAGKVQSEGSVTTLRAVGPEDTNSITEPARIVPVTEPLKNVASSFRYTFPAWSIAVLEIEAQGPGLGMVSGFTNNEAVARPATFSGGRR